MKVGPYFIVFCLGFISCLIIVGLLFYSGTETFLGTGFAIGDSGSPSDWINEEEIIIFEDEILIRVANVSLSRYASTGSMSPTFGGGANGLVIIPQNENEIDIGDVVSFRSLEGLIVHRIIEQGIDEEGTYFITRGDNNGFADGKIRFEDIEHVLIGILY
jgi:signal peptidase I